MTSTFKIIWRLNCSPKLTTLSFTLTSIRFLFSFCSCTFSSICSSAVYFAFLFYHPGTERSYPKPVISIESWLTGKCPLCYGSFHNSHLEDACFWQLLWPRENTENLECNIAIWHLVKNSLMLKMQLILVSRWKWLNYSWKSLPVMVSPVDVAYLLQTTTIQIRCTLKIPSPYLTAVQNCVIKLLTLWRPLLPYGYSYKASCARPG